MATSTGDNQEEHGRDEPGQEQDSEKEAERSFWSSFSRDDAKLLVVTFAGTVAANVVTVMVVAVALILARSSIAGRHTPGLVLLPCVVLGIPIVWLGVISFRLTRPMEDTTSRAYGAALLVVAVAMGLTTLLLLLVLLGDAVGVK